MDDIQLGNEPKSTSVVRDSYSHPFVEDELYRRESIDSGAEIASTRIVWTENKDLVAFSL